MLLGDIIARLDDGAGAAETLAGLDDLVLLGRVRDAAHREGVTPGEFVARAVRVFCEDASDEEWVTLIGIVGRTTEPGTACLQRMVEFALRPEEAPHACGHRH